MENMQKILSLLERMASALERSAAALEAIAGGSGNGLVGSEVLKRIGSAVSGASDSEALKDESAAEAEVEGAQIEALSEAESSNETAAAGEASETEELPSAPAVKVISSPEDWRGWDGDEQVYIDMPAAPEKNYAELFPRLSAFLQERGVSVCEVFEPMLSNSFDAKLERSALYMGRKYVNIYPFLNVVKTNLRTGSSFTLDLALFSPEVRDDINFLCRNFYEIAFLDEYKYQDYPDYKLQAHSNTVGVAHNFFSGFWFERYIAQEAELTVQRLAKQFKLAGEDFEIIRNAKVMCDNVLRELDILINFAGRQYWLECKSGDNYIDSIPSYEKLAEAFKFDSSSCFLVFLSHEPCFYRSANGGIRVCSSLNFSEKFAELILFNLENEGKIV